MGDRPLAHTPPPPPAGGGTASPQPLSEGEGTARLKRRSNCSIYTKEPSFFDGSFN